MVGRWDGGGGWEGWDSDLLTACDWRILILFMIRTACELNSDCDGGQFVFL